MNWNLIQPVQFFWKKKNFETFLEPTEKSQKRYCRKIFSIRFQMQLIFVLQMHRVYLINMQCIRKYSLLERTRFQGCCRLCKLYYLDIASRTRVVLRRTRKVEETSAVVAILLRCSIVNCISNIHAYQWHFVWINEFYAFKETTAFIEASKRHYLKLLDFLGWLVFWMRLFSWQLATNCSCIIADN